MKRKKVNRVALLLHWAGEQKAWLFLAVFFRIPVKQWCVI